MMNLKRSNIFDPIMLAWAVSLATLSNHSYGDVVYRKLSTVTVRAFAADAPSRTISAGVRVTRIASHGDQVMAVLQGQDVSQLLPGSVLEAKRGKALAEPSQVSWIPTALLKVTEVRDDYALAEVTDDGSQDALMHFPDDPSLRVGDAVRTQEMTVVQKVRLLPTKTLTYRQLFVDPKSLPLTYELTREGRQLLLDEARTFADVHAPLLLIEAHTDLEGPRESNQIESLQRAQTIRQILIDELGFDPERIVAVGLGESEPLVEPYLPGQAERARRIILRVKSLPPAP